MSVSSDTVLHTLPLLVWFVGSLLSCNKSYSRPLLLLLKMEHKFQSKSLSELEVAAVTKEGRKSVLLVVVYQETGGINRKMSEKEVTRIAYSISYGGIYLGTKTPYVFVTHCLYC